MRRTNKHVPCFLQDNVALGTGHGAWMPKYSDSDPWLQVDLPGHMEVKGIITQVGILLQSYFRIRFFWGNLL